MGRKKKTEEPIFKPMEVPAPPPPPATIKPLANYGADEKPRQCIHCASKNSRVNRTRTAGRITIRARVCQSCGKNFVTREIAP